MDNTNTPNDNRELNLWDLIVSFFKWKKKCCIAIVSAIGKILQLTFQHIIIVALLTIIGFGAGFYVSRPSARVYKAEAMAWLNGPSAQVVKQVSKQAETAFPKFRSESRSLSTLLGLPDSVANNIRRIESFYVIDYLNDSTPDAVDFKRKHPMTDTLNVIFPHCIYFRVRTKNVEQLPMFEEAFVNYLNSNSNIISLHQNYKTDLTNRQLAYKTELERLDSLERLTYLQPKLVPQVVTDYNHMIVGELSTQILFKDLLRVLDRQRRAAPFYSMCTAPVVFIDHFAAIPKAVNNRIICCLLGTLAGYIIGLLVALCVKRRKQIVAYLRNK